MYGAVPSNRSPHNRAARSKSLLADCTSTARLFANLILKCAFDDGTPLLCRFTFYHISKLFNSRSLDRYKMYTTTSILLLHFTLEKCRLEKIFCGDSGIYEKLSNKISVTLFANRVENYTSWFKLLYIMHKYPFVGSSEILIHLLIFGNLYFGRTSISFIKYILS